MTIKIRPGAHVRFLDGVGNPQFGHVVGFVGDDCKYVRVIDTCGGGRMDHTGKTMIPQWVVKVSQIVDELK